MRWYYVAPPDLNHVRTPYIEAELADGTLLSWWRDTIGPPLSEAEVRERYPEALDAWMRRDDALADLESELAALDQELEGRRAGQDSNPRPRD